MRESSTYFHGLLKTGFSYTGCLKKVMGYGVLLSYPINYKPYKFLL